MDRNQQLDLFKALAAALESCNQAGEPGEPVVGGINVVPIDRHGNPDINLHGDDFPDYHPVDLTASGLVEALKLLGAMPDTITPIGAADTRNTPQDQARFAAEHKGLAAELTAVFNEIDARALQTAVLDHREVAMPVALEAIDDVLGDIADPYADEDDEL